MLRLSSKFSSSPVSFQPSLLTSPSFLTLFVTYLHLIFSRSVFEVDGPKKKSSAAFALLAMDDDGDGGDRTSSNSEASSSEPEVVVKKPTK